MKNNDLKRLSVRMPKNDYEALSKSAVKNNRTLSDELRHVVKEYLKISKQDEHLDDTISIIHNSMKVHIDKLGNRLAALFNRNTIMAAASYYSAISLLSKILSTEDFLDFREIEKRARLEALKFANTKDRNAISKFMEDEALDIAIKAIVEADLETDNDDLDDYYDYI